MIYQKYLHQKSLTTSCMCCGNPGPSGGLGRNSGPGPTRRPRDPLSKDAQWQLREGDGRLRRQRGLGGKPQAFPEIRRPAPQLPEGHAALAERAAAASASTQVSPAACAASARHVRVTTLLSCSLFCHSCVCALLLFDHKSRK